MLRIAAILFDRSRCIHIAWSCKLSLHPPAINPDDSARSCLYGNAVQSPMVTAVFKGKRIDSSLSSTSIHLREPASKANQNKLTESDHALRNDGTISPTDLGGIDVGCTTKPRLTHVSSNKKVESEIKWPTQRLLKQTLGEHPGQNMYDQNSRLALLADTATEFPQGISEALNPAFNAPSFPLNAEPRSTTSRRFDEGSSSRSARWTSRTNPDAGSHQSPLHILEQDDTTQSSLQTGTRSNPCGNSILRKSNKRKEKK